jgi:hypothetical protein
MNNECGNAHTLSTNGKTHYCNLGKEHTGVHADMAWSWPHIKAIAVWARREAPKPKTDEHNVLFTLEELAELYSILSGNHEIPEVYLNKVGKALKEAL